MMFSKAFYKTLYPVLRALGWTFGNGFRDTDFYIFPPGITKEKHSVRKDYFDSYKKLLSFLTSDRTWNRNREMRNAVERFQSFTSTNSMTEGMYLAHTDGSQIVWVTRTRVPEFLTTSKSSKIVNFRSDENLLEDKKNIDSSKNDDVENTKMNEATQFRQMSLRKSKRLKNKRGTKNKVFECEKKSQSSSMRKRKFNENFPEARKIVDCSKNEDVESKKMNQTTHFERKPLRESKRIKHKREVIVRNTKKKKKTLSNAELFIELVYPVLKKLRWTKIVDRGLEGESFTFTLFPPGIPEESRNAQRKINIHQVLRAVSEKKEWSENLELQEAIRLFEICHVKKRYSTNKIFVRFIFPKLEELGWTIKEMIDENKLNINLSPPSTMRKSELFHKKYFGTITEVLTAIEASLECHQSPGLVIRVRLFKKHFNEISSFHDKENGFINILIDLIESSNEGDKNQPVIREEDLFQDLIWPRIEKLGWSRLNKQQKTFYIPPRPDLYIQPQPDSQYEDGIDSNQIMAELATIKDNYGDIDDLLKMFDLYYTCEDLLKAGIDVSSTIELETKAKKERPALIDY